MPSILLSLNILKIFYLEQNIILKLFLSDKGVISPENKGKIQIFVDVLIHHNNKTRT